MIRKLWIFFTVVIITFLIDQGIKQLFLDGYSYVGSCIDLTLHFNKGVAFSMFAFIGPYLKWLQALLIVGMLYYLVKEGYAKRYGVATGLLVGGALGNLYDRFIHEGVVDYVAWHCGFRFAVFNYADVAIDLAVVWLVWVLYRTSEKGEKEA